MQISPAASLKSPSEYFESFSLLRMIKLFKFELIKVIIFLFLFAASLVYVSSESSEYYKGTRISISE